jgi:hypothetical protein
MKYHAGVAQLAEHFTRNEGVAGSNPVSSTRSNLCGMQGFFDFKVVGWGEWKVEEALSDQPVMTHPPFLFIFAKKWCSPLYPKD